MFEKWRLGTHYGIHVYAGDRPVATFHSRVDAGQAVADHNSQEPRLGYATTRQLLRELDARAEMDGSADYRTVDSK